MSIDTNKWDELLRQTTGNYRVDNTDEDIARFRKKLFRFNFFRFSFYTFNIFYASVAFGMIVIGSYTGYKYVYITHKKSNLSTPILTAPADTALKADTLQKTGEPGSAILTPKPYKTKKPETQQKIVSTCKTDTNKINSITPDTIKLTVSDTIYKKVKVVVHDTVKIKKKRAKQLK